LCGIAASLLFKPPFKLLSRAFPLGFFGSPLIVIGLKTLARRPVPFHALKFFKLLPKLFDTLNFRPYSRPIPIGLRGTISEFQCWRPGSARVCMADITIKLTLLRQFGHLGAAKFAVLL
jgi:hypothetical protein